MKAFVLLGLLCLSLLASAQEYTKNEAGQAEIALVLDAPGSQDALFLKGKDWLYRTYASGKTVEQTEDKAAGHILARARTITLKWNAGLGVMKDAGDFSYELLLDFKDGKARIIATNIVYQQGGPGSMLLKSGANLADDYPANWQTFGKKSMQAHWKLMQESVKAELTALEQSFGAALLTKPKDF